MAQSEGNPCDDPACPDATHPWTLDSATYNLGFWSAGCTGSCNATVKFKRRTSCGYCEYRITVIEYPYPGCNCPYYDVAKFAIDALLLNSPMPGCSPDLGQCVNNVRVSIGACMIQSMSGGTVTLTNCGPTEICCGALYQVCRGLDNQPHITQLTIDGNIVSCGPNPNCKSACELLPPTLAN